MVFSGLFGAFLSIIKCMTAMVPGSCNEHPIQTWVLADEPAADHTRQGLITKVTVGPG